MPTSKLISVDTAIKYIKSNFTKISNEDVFLQNALGRCLAQPVYSNINNPKYDVSSMDGYAINHNDFIELNSNIKNNSKKIIKFKINGESSAGNPFEKKIKPFEAVRIFTGAKVPQGCDTVLIQENVQVSNDQNYISTQAIVKKLWIADTHFTWVSLDWDDLTEWRIKGLWYFDKRQSHLKYRLIGVGISNLKAN